MLENAKSPEAYEEMVELFEWPPDEDIWGETAEAEAGQNAMLALMGTQ